MRARGPKPPKARVRAARGKRGRARAPESLVRGAANDTIFVRGLRVDTLIGVNSWERLKRQPVLIDLHLECDTHQAALSDHLRDALDYAGVAASVRKFVAASRCRMLEHLAEGVASHCLRDERVSEVRVRIEKHWALGDGAIAGIEISRRRAER